MKNILINTDAWCSITRRSRSYLPVIEIVLAYKVKLDIGGQVILRRNIICDEGLVNGAREIIIGFSWADGAHDQEKKEHLSQKVYVNFHDPCVGLVSRDYLSEQAVPIEPVTAKFYGKPGVSLKGTQLPLLPSWAATIRKVQDLSLDAVVIDLGPKMFGDGMAYVA